MNENKSTELRCAYVYTGEETISGILLGVDAGTICGGADYMHGPCDSHLFVSPIAAKQSLSADSNNQQGGQEKDCACPRIDSNDCFKVRYGSTPDFQEEIEYCECGCHDYDPDDSADAVCPTTADAAPIVAAGSSPSAPLSIEPPGPFSGFTVCNKCGVVHSLERCPSCARIADAFSRGERTGMERAAAIAVQKARDCNAVKDVGGEVACETVEAAILSALPTPTPNKE